MLLFPLYSCNDQMNLFQNYQNCLLLFLNQKSSLFLQIIEPKNEQIADRKTIKISGKTNPEATVAILTTTSEEIIQPSREGDFNTTIQIDDGINYIKIQAILPSGESQTVHRIVSYTTEEF